MQKIPIHIIPSPGSKDEFMATVQPTNDQNSDKGKEEVDITTVKNVWNAMIQQLQQGNDGKSDSTAIKIVLEGYTRDSWSWKPNVEGWTTTIRVCSTSTTTIDPAVPQKKKRKLYNFVQYLKERQKSAYGRFGTTGIIVVSYVQQQRSSSNDNNDDEDDTMDCRIALDGTKIPNCTLVQIPQQKSNAGGTIISPTDEKRQLPKQQEKMSVSTSATTSNSTSKKKGMGLLSKLVGAQQRTNEHVVLSRQKARTFVTTTQQQQQPQQTSSNEDSQSIFVLSPTDVDHTLTTTTMLHHDPATEISSKSAQDVIQDFRNECHTKMLNFDLEEETDMIQIPIVLKDYTQYVTTEEDKLKITMEVLKYIVYEAAEEVNEEWVVVKEPSEYMDDIVLTIYKEGAAPEEALIDDHIELPDEVRGQQRAIQEQRSKIIQQKEQKLIQEQQKIVSLQQQDDDDLEVLNTKKRDRRTIEDYEREKKAKI